MPTEGEEVTLGLLVSDTKVYTVPTYGLTTKVPPQGQLAPDVVATKVVTASVPVLPFRFLLFALRTEVSVTALTVLSAVRHKLHRSPVRSLFGEPPSSTSSCRGV